MRIFYLSNQYASSSVRYDPLSSCLVDFKGRANMASVKNFQLVHSSSADLDTKKSQEIDAEKDYILQVGKVCCTTLHYTTLHYTTLHYTTLHCTTLHYTVH